MGFIYKEFKFTYMERLQNRFTPSNIWGYVTPTHEMNYAREY
jgi:hypothetical protein